MKLLAFDVETRGADPMYALEPFRTLKGDARITSFATARMRQGLGVHSVARCDPSVDDLRTLLTTCKDTGTTIVGWNTAFDVAWLIAMGLREEVFACRWLDAMLLYKHATNRSNIPGEIVRSYGLKLAVKTFYPDEAGYEEGVDFQAEDVLSIVKRLRYNRKDAEFTLRLALKFLDMLTPAQRRVALIEARSIPLVADTTINGIAFNPHTLNTLERKLTDARNVAYVSLKVRDPEITVEALNSPLQLGGVLFDRWKLPPIKMTNTHKFSTDKEVLAELSLRDERAKFVRDYREATGNCTKFATNPSESLHYNDDGRVRPQARIFSTYTGRMTYSSTNGKGKNERQTGVALHQWKRGAEYRRPIEPPEGYELLEFDFAGQEFGWMAVESKDHTMLAMRQPGEDAHSYMGARIYDLNYRELMARVAAEDVEAKQQRFVGKFANLSLQYRTGAARLQQVARVQYGIPMTSVEAIKIHSAYRSAYPGVQAYWSGQIYAARTNGYVENLAGRRVYLGQGIEWDTETRWARESTAINFPIQSIGADQKYLALSVLRDAMTHYDAKLYFELHDGLFVIAPPRKAEKAAHELKHLLSNLPYKKAWGYEPPIPFPVDAKRGPTWGDLKEVK